MSLIDPAPRRRIDNLLTQVEETLGVRLAVHDHRGLFRLPDGEPLLGKRHQHTHPYCESGKYTSAGWNLRCRAHCLDIIIPRAAREGEPFVAVCWKGAKEVIVPIIEGPEHVSTIYAGAFREEPAPPGVAELPAAMQAAYAALPELTAENAARIAGILHVLGQGLLKELRPLHGIQEGELSRQSAIRRFVYFNADKPVGLRELAAALHLSPSRTSHAVQEIFGLPFQTLLAQERIRRAKALLIGTDLPHAQIAARVGIRNEYYLNRLFKQIAGETPGRFRRQHRL